MIKMETAIIILAGAIVFWAIVSRFKTVHATDDKNIPTVSQNSNDGEQNVPDTQQAEEEYRRLQIVKMNLFTYDGTGKGQIDVK